MLILMMMMNDGCNMVVVIESYGLILDAVKTEIIAIESRLKRGL